MGLLASTSQLGVESDTHLVHHGMLRLPIAIGRPLPVSGPAMENLGWKELIEGKPISWAITLNAPSNAAIPPLPWICMEAPHHPEALSA